MKAKYLRQLLVLLLCLMLPLYSIAVGLPISCPNMAQGMAVSMANEHTDMLSACNDCQAKQTSLPDSLCKVGVACAVSASIIPSNDRWSAPTLEWSAAHHPITPVLPVSEFPRNLLRPPILS